jgi:hypothetical protein
MAIPVLKNRILLLTGGQFRESEFGASSFRQFLSLLPTGIVTVDDSQAPGFVDLVLNEVKNSPSDRSHHTRIRSDLWRATLDYSSRQRYVWDSTLKQATPAKADDAGPFIPTISEDEFNRLRHSFVEAHLATEKGAEDRIKRWAVEGLPTAFLPARLRPLWNIELKKQVEERLKPWFTENHIEPPSDFSYQWQVSASRSGSDQLRQFVMSCIRAMTDEELAELRIPAKVAMRAKPDGGA